MARVTTVWNKGVFKEVDTANYLEEHSSRVEYDSEEEFSVPCDESVQAQDQEVIGIRDESAEDLEDQLLDDEEGLDATVLYHDIERVAVVHGPSPFVDEVPSDDPGKQLSEKEKAAVDSPLEADIGERYSDESDDDKIQRKRSHSGTDEDVIARSKIANVIIFFERDLRCLIRYKPLVITFEFIF